MEPGRYALLEAVGVGYGVDVLEGNATNAGIAGNLVVQRILLRFLLLERDGKAAADHAWAVLVDHRAGDAIGSCGIQLGTFSPVGDALSLENLFQVFKDGEVAALFILGSGGEIDKGVMGEQNGVQLDGAMGVRPDGINHGLEGCDDFVQSLGLDGGITGSANRNNDERHVGVVEETCGIGFGIANEQNFVHLFVNLSTGGICFVAGKVDASGEPLHEFKFAVAIGKAVFADFVGLEFDSAGNGREILGIVADELCNAHFIDDLVAPGTEPGTYANLCRDEGKRIEAFTF